MMCPMLRRERLILNHQPAFPTRGVEVPFETAVLVGEGEHPVIAALNTIFYTDAVNIQTESDRALH